MTGDVILGLHVKDKAGSNTRIPVMYQKGQESNFSLLELIMEAINANNTKIIQLNFASIDAVSDAILILLIKRREVCIAIQYMINQ